MSRLCPEQPTDWPRLAEPLPTHLSFPLLSQPSAQHHGLSVSPPPLVSFTGVTPQSSRTSKSILASIS